MSDKKAVKKVLEDLKKKYPQDSKVLDKAIDETNMKIESEKIDSSTEEKLKAARKRAAERLKRSGIDPEKYKEKSPTQ